MPPPLPRIVRLFSRERGLCYWCDGPMSLDKRNHFGKPPPDDMATVDHLYERFDPRRWMPTKPHEGEDDRFVCACSKCNNARQRLNWARLSPGQRQTYNALPRTFWPEYFKAQVKIGVTPSIPYSLAQLLSALQALPRGVRTTGIRKAAAAKYPPLPPVPPEEQGPRPGDHPVFFEQLKQAAE